MSKIQLQPFSFGGPIAIEPTLYSQRIADQIEYPKTEDWKEELKNSEAKFVFFGVCEDIGIKAGLGKVGARATWFHTANELLSFPAQSNLDQSKLFVLGQLEMKPLLVESDWLDPLEQEDSKQFGELLDLINEKVAEVIAEIVDLGKVPIVIGGGQNNTLGILQGWNKSTKTKLTAFNLDNRLDLKVKLNKHHQNQYNYALSEQLLEKYLAFGTYRYLVDKSEVEYLNHSNEVEVLYYEDAFIDQVSEWKTSVAKMLANNKDCKGFIDIDMTCLKNGELSITHARQWLLEILHNSRPKAFQLSEGVCELGKGYGNTMQRNISFLVLDFIRNYRD